MVDLLNPRKRISYSKGHSSVGFILGFTIILIFIFIPMFMFLIERVAVIIVADDIKDAVDQSFLSVYAAMRDDYSKKRVDMDEDLLKNKFRLLLRENIKWGDDIMLQELSEVKYHVEDMADGYMGNGITVVSFQVEVTLKSFLNIVQRKNTYELTWHKELPINY